MGRGLAPRLKMVSLFCCDTLPYASHPDPPFVIARSWNREGRKARFLPSFARRHSSWRDRLRSAPSWGKSARLTPMDESTERRTGMRVVIEQTGEGYTVIADSASAPEGDVPMPAEAGPQSFASLDEAWEMVQELFEVGAPEAQSAEQKQSAEAFLGGFNEARGTPL